ncbi:uncharacterized protein EI90DRAFT_2998333, partial [Cantharellus anzutake]|uniref:uncharacterized protein n=1 Tax=Cantharellus anzutake TaxID=1750568 RepID=UPI001905874F
MAPAYPVARRVSYVIPPPSGHRTKLVLPPIDARRRGRTFPLILPDNEAPSPSASLQGEGDSRSPPRYRHGIRSSLSAAGVSLPQHRLGVSSLAIDMSTKIAGKGSPEGILYSAGRDGLVMAWEVGAPTQPRKRKPRERSGPGIRSRKGDWKVMTAWDDEDEDLSDEGSDSDASDLTQLTEDENEPLIGEGLDKTLPHEQQWVVDHEKAENLTIHSVFRQGVQAHNDWVNDIALCNLNQSVVSASNDGLVKLWSPHDPTPSSLPSVIGKHADYVHCLAHTPKKPWIASGSFDRTIRLWDISRSVDSASSSVSSLNTLSPIITLSLPDASAKASIYALAVDSSGNMIASGSPERVVRLWDPRSGKRVGKLVGHTDNIRSILISDDGKYILTGSSDASIKIWSVSGQRCLHTFSHHTESVWTLFSSHPNLSIFYSGDKSGLVCKVDMENCGDIAEGECMVLCRDTGDGSAQNRCKEGINRLLAVDNWAVWTATGASDIKRWRDPGSRFSRMTYSTVQNWDHSAPPSIMDTMGLSRMSNGHPASRSSTPIALFRGESRQSTGGPSAFIPVADTPRSASPRFFEVASLAPSPPQNRPPPHHSVHSIQSIIATDEPQEIAPNTLYGIRFESLVKLAPSDAGFTFKQSLSHGDPEVATLYSAASVLSVPVQHRASQVQSKESHSPPTSSASPFYYPAHAGSTGSYKATQPGSLSQLHDGQIVDASLPQAEYESREVAVQAKPLRSSPEEVLKGSHGLVRSVILNDRIHALTVDTSGEVAVWDLVRGTYIGYFSSEEVETASMNGSSGDSQNQNEINWSPRESLETVRERIEGEAMIASWATVDTKMGSLTVHLSETTCFDAEVYADEVGFAGNPSFPDEHRLNVGKWVLNNLFAGFIRAEALLVSRSSGGLSATPGKGIQRVTPGTLNLEAIKERRLRSNSDLTVRTQRTPGVVTALSTLSMTPAIIPEVPKLLPAPSWPRSGFPSLPAKDIVSSIPASPSALGSPTPRLAQSPAPIGGMTSFGKAISSADYFSLPPSSSVEHGPTPSQVSGAPMVPLTPGRFMRSWKNFGKPKKTVAEDISTPQPVQETSEPVEESTS